jgi:hypothetical protein
MAVMTDRAITANGSWKTANPFWYALIPRWVFLLPWRPFR